MVNEVSRYWDFSLNSNGIPDDASSSEVTVTATDAAAGTVTRRRTADARIDTQFLNQPLPGLRYRTANSCTANGAPRYCDGTLTLPLTGTGMAVYAGQGPTTYLGVSISQP